MRPPQQSKTSSIPAGRWSRHLDGYYIRYLPKSYQTVTVQIYVPPAATEHRGSGDSPAIGL